MAPKVLEIINIDDDYDDEISIIYSTTPFSSFKNRAAISVEDYHPLEHKRKFDDDDDVKFLYSFPKTQKKLFKGECSNSKTEHNTKLKIVPLTFICEICTDEKPKNAIFRVLGCRHFYCSECMKKYVASKLQDNVIAINCPVSDCKGSLEPQHCTSILPKQVFDRWSDTLCEAVILATEKFYCPFKDCSALLVDDKNGLNDEVIVESECPECNRLFCVQCKVAWHAGINCSEFQKLNKDERTNEDIKLMNLAKRKKWMRCPGCRIYIQKNRGCAHMLCRCGCNFIYDYKYSEL
ncbi:hypothetical protein CASFOL_032376 [Castilleja foliolosa]|uniref:RBR-type E3 ubiquitin transferase n=1 Tax=Castilleja foliolosa TaxID=1961234 RepID=A0ABD3C3X1_9LAMI